MFTNTQEEYTTQEAALEHYLTNYNYGVNDYYDKLKYDEEGNEFEERPLPNKGASTYFQDLTGNQYQLRNTLYEDNLEIISERDLNYRVDQLDRISKYLYDFIDYLSLYKSNDQQKEYKVDYSAILKVNSQSTAQRNKLKRY